MDVSDTLASHVDNGVRREAASVRQGDLSEGKRPGREPPGTKASVFQLSFVDRNIIRNRSCRMDKEELLAFVPQYPHSLIAWRGGLDGEIYPPSMVVRSAIFSGGKQLNLIRTLVPKESNGDTMYALRSSNDTVRPTLELVVAVWPGRMA